MIESIMDLNCTNVWSLEAQPLTKMWEKGKEDEEFPLREEKLLNIIRLAFEVVHYNTFDIRDVKRYENGEWAIMTHLKEGRERIAIKKRVVRCLADLGTENVKQITAATVLNLISRNFGGGWDSIPSATRNIICTAFDVSSTQLPTSRLHVAGGTLERMLAQGYEVLEVPKGTWTEAIFVKKKDPMEDFDLEDIPDDNAKAADDSNAKDSDEDEGLNAPTSTAEAEEDGINDNDDTFYSSYSAEAEVKEGEEESFGQGDEEGEEEEEEI